MVTVFHRHVTGDRIVAFVGQRDVGTIWSLFSRHSPIGFPRSQVHLAHLTEAYERAGVRKGRPPHEVAGIPGCELSACGLTIRVGRATVATAPCQETTLNESFFEAVVGIKRADVLVCYGVGMEAQVEAVRDGRVRNGLLTRRRVLEAAIVCLVRDGYAATTTAGVAEVAGVSRGALMHQFQTREELVAAAVEHLAVRRREELAGRVAGLPAGDGRVGAVLDLMWETTSGDWYGATLAVVDGVAD